MGGVRKVTGTLIGCRPIRVAAAVTPPEPHNTIKVCMVTDFQTSSGTTCCGLHSNTSGGGGAELACFKRWELLVCLFAPKFVRQGVAMLL